MPVWSNTCTANSKPYCKQLTICACIHKLLFWAKYTFFFRKNYPSLIQTITLDKNRGLQDLSSLLSSPLLLFVLEITCRYPEIITSLPPATRRTWPKMLVSKSEKNENTYLKNPATQFQVDCVYIKQILLLGQLRQLPRFMYSGINSFVFLAHTLSPARLKNLNF